MALENYRDKNYHNEWVNHPDVGQKCQANSREVATKYSLINEEVSLPAAVIQQSKLNNNLDWMQRFAQQHQVKLCPHGKTTMIPSLFRQQLEHGAWGITVATAAQAEVAASAGATQIIIANQLVGKVNMAIVANLIEQRGVNIYTCVDSTLNVKALGEYFAQRQIPLNLLIEYGVEGGRCGCRDQSQVLSLARFIQQQSHLILRGIEVYEGVIHGDNAEEMIRQFLNQALALTRALKQEALIADKPMVTGAGSAWYDVVSECFSNLDDVEAIIRPGCYAIHDTGIYLAAQNKVMARAEKNQGVACDLGGDLQSSLEVWAHVLSRPESNRLVVGLGKRDVAFDAGLPTPERAYRNGQLISVGNAQTIAVMDQHAFIEIDSDNELNVGDIIAFSTSHPCLTIDKWRSIAICDDDYQVTHWVETCF